MMNIFTILCFTLQKTSSPITVFMRVCVCAVETVHLVHVFKDSWKVELVQRPSACKEPRIRSSRRMSAAEKRLDPTLEDLGRHRSLTWR